MKISQIIFTIAVTANLFTTATFAVPIEKKVTAPVRTEQNNSADNNMNKDLHIDHKKCKDGKCKGEFKDPIKSLEGRKENILKLQKEGKISKEEADEKIKIIDTRIKGIEEFNKLTVEQKRAKLIEKFKEIMALQVKYGKISQEKADELISEYTKKMQEWDGNGIPKFYHKRHDKPIQKKG